MKFIVAKEQDPWAVGLSRIKKSKSGTVRVYYRAETSPWEHSFSALVVVRIKIHFFCLFLSFVAPLSSKTSSYDAVLHDPVIMTTKRKWQQQINELAHRIRSHEMTTLEHLDH